MNSMTELLIMRIMDNINGITEENKFNFLKAWIEDKDPRLWNQLKSLTRWPYLGKKVFIQKVVPCKSIPRDIFITLCGLNLCRTGIVPNWLNVMPQAMDISLTRISRFGGEDKTGMWRCTSTGDSYMNTFQFSFML